MNRAKTRGPGRQLLGLAVLVLGLCCSRVQAQAPADPYNYSRSTSYTYDAKGRVQTETVEPDNLPSCVINTYGYDTWGNRNSSTVANCAGAVPARQQFVARTSSVDYTASSGIFPGISTNALNQNASAGFDPRFGVKTSATDASGLSIAWQVDDFGRVTKETKPDGTSVVTQYCYLPGRVSNTTSNSAGCASSVPADAPADAVMYAHAEPRDTANAKMGPYSRTYADRLGRKIREVTESFDGANQPAALRGALIVKDTVYSAQGVIVLQTQPYFLATGSSTATGSNDAGVSRTVVDALGRPSTVYTADPNGLAGAQSFGDAGVSYGNYGTKVASKVVFAYSGQTTTTTNDKGQVRTEEKNAIGLLVRITDPAGGQLAHQHDAFGNLVATKDALQNQITLKYDILGRKLELNDPDAGLWKYDYDALGQLVWQQSANQRAASTQTTMAYDKLGRMTTRVEPEGTGTWSYDKYADQSACNKGAGRLCESSFQRAGTSDIRRTKFYFDNLGRPASDVATITNGPTMATAKSYHATTGRLDTKTYPTGLKVQYGYTVLGFAHQLKTQTQLTSPVNLTAGAVLWQVNVVNAWGTTEQQQWSNGVIGRSTFEATTGRTTGLTAGPGSSTSVINHSYSWDSLNNLTYRADHIGDAVAGAVTETFEYGDSLARLTKYTVAAPAIAGGSRSVTLQYNALGMLLNKSDVGVYTYGPSGAGQVRPHALLSMVGANGEGTTSYVYDANGNLITASAGKYRSVSYTSFNLPDGQAGIDGAPGGSSGGTARYTWVYDENHQRIKEVRTITGGTNAGTRTTWYLHPDNAGALGFERETNPQATNNRHYLSFGGRTLGVIISSGDLPGLSGGTAPTAQASMAPASLEYWHKDHLGSLIATTSHQGTVTARYAYDPFGKRRYTNGSYDAFGTIVVDWSYTAASPAGTDRGYTEHEHLDDIGLIHMNGRIFDPTLGRFMQADRFVQAPTDLQNYNRYSYCRNNPLTCTDPTGFVSTETQPLQIPSFNHPAEGLAWLQANGAAVAAAGYDVASMYASLQNSVQNLNAVAQYQSPPDAGAYRNMDFEQMLRDISFEQSSPFFRGSTSSGQSAGTGYNAEANALNLTAAAATTATARVVIVGARPLFSTSLWVMRFGGALACGAGPWACMAGVAIIVSTIPGDTDGANNNVYAKPPDNARDPEGPKAPGKPGEQEGFKDPKGGEQWVKNPNGPGYGWLDSKGNVWVPTGQGGSAHGGPHWDVQQGGGGYENIYPGGGRRNGVGVAR